MASVRTIDDVRAALDNKQIEITKVQKTIDALDEELKNSSITEADRRQIRESQNLLRMNQNELAKQQTVLLNKLDERMFPLFLPRSSGFSHCSLLSFALFLLCASGLFFPHRRSVERAQGNAAPLKDPVQAILGTRKFFCIFHWRLTKIN